MKSFLRHDDESKALINGWCYINEIFTNQRAWPKYQFDILIEDFYFIHWWISITACDEYHRFLYALKITLMANNDRSSLGKLMVRMGDVMPRAMSATGHGMTMSMASELAIKKYRKLISSVRDYSSSRRRNIENHEISRYRHRQTLSNHAATAAQRPC